MPSSYSTNLKIELQATGENSGTWGTITNTNLGTALEQAIVGYGNPSYASDANLTLTYTDTNAAQAARALVLNVTSAVSLTNTRELVVPTIQKQYIVQNNTTGSQSITVKTSAGTGITVPNGRKAHLYVDGTNVIYMDDYVDINGGAIDGTPIGANSASTGAFTTLSASGNITVSGGTANGVLYLNGSKVATSGSALVFDGTNLGVGVTPSAWTVIKAVEVGGTGGNYIGGTTTNLYLGANNFYDGAYKYKSNGFASQIQLGAGTVQFYTAPSGTAGGTITFSETMRVDASGNLGIGTSSPAYKLDVNGNAQVGNATAATNRTLFINGVASKASRISFQESGVDRWLIGNGAASENGNFEIYDATNGNNFVLTRSGNLGLGVTPSAWSIRALQVGSGFAAWSSGTTNARIFANTYYDGAYKYVGTGRATQYEQDGYHAWYTSASGTAGNAITFTQAMTLDASGNLLVGPTSNLGTNRRELVLQSANGSLLNLGINGAVDSFQLVCDSGPNALIINKSNTPMIFYTNNTERARITSGGQALFGSTSENLSRWGRALFNYPCGTSNAVIGLQNGTARAANNLYGIVFADNTDESNAAVYVRQTGANNAADLLFGTNAGTGGAGLGAVTERARITSDGIVCIGQTSSNIANTGISLCGDGSGVNGRGRFCTDNTEVIEVNRKTSDGGLVLFYQDTVQEGSISVAGNTVSYNAFAGSHWSQLQDGSKPDILRGTVMESINELCVWPGEQNERLPKSKISDTAGSKKVYGVFMAWDNDWTATNDMLVTSVGAFICRVNGSVTVQEGDLLESNGDGTARVQADDIIRSSTIGKVTSTVKTHQYDDGSYCVPTVLYCG